MDKILRAPWHDYTCRCIYMVTLKKSPDIEAFGALEGDYRLQVGEKGAAYIMASRTGRAVKDCIRRFGDTEPHIRVLQYALMPDHLHMLLFVTEPTEEILGRIIARFKVSVNKAVGDDNVFTKGFNDQILHRWRSLDVLYKYLRDNPRRLAVRREHPEYFRRVNNLTVGGRRVQAYGNILLLRSPFMAQVVVHRRDTEDVRRVMRERWLYTAANGGVLVSPFISPAEKAVRDEAEALGAKIILISNRAMGERYKPAAREFALCEQGRLLILSPEGIDPSLSRAACLEMNSIAEALCSESV